MKKGTCIKPLLCTVDSNEQLAIYARRDVSCLTCMGIGIHSFMSHLVTFNAPLNEKADIFQRMNNNPPSWWDKLIGLNGVYVEIRKRNRIHVYYEGGRIAELRVDEGKMSTTCHPNMPLGC